MPFTKGLSGNPAGRPKTDERLKQLARGKTEEAFGELVALMSDADPRVRLGACNSVLDRGWGKPVQAVEAQLEQQTQFVIEGPPMASSIEEWERMAKLALAASQVIEPPPGSDTLQ